MVQLATVVLCLWAFAACTQAGVIDIAYGVPINKPFKTYGLPEERSLVLDTVRVPESTPEKLDIVFEQKPLVAEAIGRSILPELKEEAPIAKKVSPVVRTDERNQYAVGFRNPDGTVVKEEGRLISTDNGWEYVIAKTGSYSYTSPEGKLVEVDWVADEKGFRILKTTV